MPTQSNASADGIHFLITRPDRQLGAESRFTRDSFDFDGPIVDLGDFELEKLDNKARISPGKNDLGAVDALLHRFDIATDTFADLILFGWHTFAVRQQRLIFHQIDDYIRTLEPAYSAADDVSQTIFEFSKD